MTYAPSLPDQRDDIQAILASGFGWLESSRFSLMTVRDAALAKRWLVKLVDSDLVKSIAAVSECRDKGARPGELASIAFSHAGLRTLGLRESGEFPFPTAFRLGMGSDLRRHLLRDGAREQWRWSDCEPDAQRGLGPGVVHILLAQWWQKGGTPRLPLPDPAAFDVTAIEGSPKFFREDGAMFEPFDFRDGISQPVIHGLKNNIDAGPAGRNPAPEEKPVWDQVIAPGEFILGYRNEYDELSYCADVQGWDTSKANHAGGRFAMNGSYIAAREIDQHLAEFARLPAPRSAGGPAGPTLTETMMGRSRDGKPLESAVARSGTGSAAMPVAAPVATPAQAADGSGAREANGPNGAAERLRYRVKDQNGFVTPRGSHIRRANPRDTLGHDVESGILSSKLHRLLRRGRPYVNVAQEKDPTAGLFFMALNTDLERQFEFVHQRWLLNPRFADLEDQVDPILGCPGGSAKARFSIPGFPSGRCVEVPALTTTRGGGYFFLPGLKALRFIAGVALQEK